VQKVKNERKIEGARWALLDLALGRFGSFKTGRVFGPL